MKQPVTHDVNNDFNTAIATIKKTSLLVGELKTLISNNYKEIESSDIYNELLKNEKTLFKVDAENKRAFVVLKDEISNFFEICSQVAINKKLELIVLIKSGNKRFEFLPSKDFEKVNITAQNKFFIYDRQNSGLKEVKNNEHVTEMYNNL